MSKPPLFYSFHRFHPLLLLCSLGAVAASGAAEPQAEPQAAAQPPMQKVEVSGPGALALRRDDTASKIIVGRDEIDLYGDNSLGALLKRQPGVSVVGAEVKMRGLGAGYTQILINGDPAPPGFSIDTIAPDMIERVEILRGASAEYSAQAIAGSINLVLRKGASRTQQQLKLTLGRGQGRTSPAVSLQASDKWQVFSYAVTGTLDSSGFYNAPFNTERVLDQLGTTSASRTSQERNFSAIDKASLTPRLNWALANGDTVTWQSLLDFYRIDNHSDARETTLLGPATQYPDNNAISQLHVLSTRSDLTWAHKVGDGGKLSVRVGATYNRRDIDYAFLGYSHDGTPLLVRDVVSTATDDSYTASGKYLSRAHGGHSFGFGWDASAIGRSENRSQRDRRPAGGAPYALDEDYTSDIRRLALFAQDEWEITPRLQLYLGVRWEGLHTATSGRTLTEVANSSGVWSPVLQTMWKLPDQQSGQSRDQVRLALARTYKAPSTRSLVPRRYTVNNGNGPTTPDFQGNPQLRPELAWGLDLAYEAYFGKSGVATLSTFARRVSDVTVQRLFQQDGVWITTPFNGGRANVHGIEADVKLPLRTWAASAPDIDLRFNLGRNWSTLDSVPGPNNRLGEQTPLTANAGVDYRMSGAYSMGANFNLQTGGPVRIDRYLGSYSGVNRTLDMYGLWKADKNTQLRLSLSNALRQDQLQGQSYRDGNGATERSSVTPGSATARIVLERTL